MPLHVGIAVVVDDYGRVLMIKRGKDKPPGGTWFFPGGKQEEGEGLKETAEREMWEETGLKAELWFVGREMVEGAVNWYYVGFVEELREGVPLEKALGWLRKQGTAPLAVEIARELAMLPYIIQKVDVGTENDVVRVFFRGCDWRCVFCDRNITSLYGNPVRPAEEEAEVLTPTQLLPSLRGIASSPF